MAGRAQIGSTRRFLTDPPNSGKKGLELLSFALTVLRLLKGLVHSWSDKKFRATFAMAVIVLLSGTIFYRQAEGWSWIDSLYFCVTTMATVGSDSLSPATVTGKLFTVFYIFAGVGIFVALLAQLARALIHYDPETPDRSVSENRKLP